jgi:hypothetical protein
MSYWYGNLAVSVSDHVLCCNSVATRGRLVHKLVAIDATLRVVGSAGIGVDSNKYFAAILSSTYLDKDSNSKYMVLVKYFLKGGGTGPWEFL